MPIDVTMTKHFFSFFVVDSKLNQILTLFNVRKHFKQYIINLNNVWVWG